MADLGFQSYKNSTVTPLGSSETFTGEGEQNHYSQVGVMVKTDNTGTLYFDFSGDGVNWDSTFPTGGFKIASGIPDFHTAVKLGRYFRVRFVNDSGAQTYLRLHTYYGNNYVPTSAPYNQSLGIDSDAIATRPSIPEDEIVLGRRSGVTHFSKWGYRTGLTAANGEETIWADTGNDFTPMTSASTFTIAYNNTTDGLGQNGALSLQIVYIDSTGLSQTAVHVLSNTGSDTTSFSGLGINRVAVISTGSANVNTNAISITETTGGTAQAYIPAGASVTQQCIFFTDINSDAVAKMLFVECNKISGGGSPRVLIKGYVFNRPIATQFEIFRLTIDTSSDSHVQINEPVGFKFTPGDVLWFVADTDTNNTEINMRFSLVEYKRSQRTTNGPAIVRRVPKKESAYHRMPKRVSD